MCSDSGTDASASSDISESSTESSVENSDSSTELCENSKYNESSEELAETSNNESNEDLAETSNNESNEDLLENNDSLNEESEQSNKSENEVVEEKGTQEENDVKNGTDDNANRAEISELSQYSEEVNDKISSVEELEIYQKANLKEENIDGRTCLVRDNIDLEYVDAKSGMTNQELMEKGRNPYDAKTGERIELHHIGQDYDSPLAELTENTEHGDYDSVLHTKDGESWRSDSQKNNHYNNVERPGHWKARVRGG